ncbi:MAG: hypothetical protein MJ176_10320 [Treponema sp.]|nr:hypothetical protein [Treponema sp.]
MKKLIGLFIGLLLAANVFCQSNEKVSVILNSSEITYGQACYLSAVYQNLIADTDTEEQAVEALFNNGQLPDMVYAGDSIPLVNLSFIFTKMMNVKGGLMYRLTKGSPRYAFKQLKSDGILKNNDDPSKILTGTEALSLFTSCFMKYSEEPVFTESL